jgi:hypothetical protein
MESTNPKQLKQNFSTNCIFHETNLNIDFVNNQTPVNLKSRPITAEYKYKNNKQKNEVTKKVIRGSQVKKPNSSLYSWTIILFKPKNPSDKSENLVSGRLELTRYKYQADLTEILNHYKKFLNSTKFRSDYKNNFLILNITDEREKMYSFVQSLSYLIESELISLSGKFLCFNLNEKSYYYIHGYVFSNTSEPIDSFVKNNLYLLDNKKITSNYTNENKPFYGTECSNFLASLKVRYIKLPVIFISPVRNVVQQNRIHRIPLFFTEYTIKLLEIKSKEEINETNILSLLNESNAINFVEHIEFNFSSDIKTQDSLLEKMSNYLIKSLNLSISKLKNVKIITINYIIKNEKKTKSLLKKFYDQYINNNESIRELLKTVKICIKVCNYSSEKLMIVNYSQKLLNYCRSRILLPIIICQKFGNCHLKKLKKNVIFHIASFINEYTDSECSNSNIKIVNDLK